MRLRLETATRPPFWIIGDPLANARTEQSDAFNIGLQITRNVQAISGAGFETQLHFDRGNQKVSFDGTCRREFATPRARLDFLASLAPIITANQVHEWEGTAWLREDDGAAFTEYELPQCSLMLTGTALVGAVGLNLTYRVQAGGFGDAREGTSLVKLLGLTSNEVPPMMRIYARNDSGAGFTDSTDINLPWEGSLEVPAARWTFIINSSYDTDPFSGNIYELVPNGESPSSGLIGIDWPMRDHLDQIEAVVDLGSQISASVGSDANGAYLQIDWIDGGDFSLAKIRISVYEGNYDLSAPLIYQATATGHLVTAAWLKDDNGKVLLADSLD